MKTWLAKYRISAALDDPQSRSRGSAGCRSEHLRRFNEQMARLDLTLKQASPAVREVPGLHADILRAVRQSRFAPGPQSSRNWWRWVPVPAVACLLVLAIWFAFHPSRPADGLIAGHLSPATVLDLGAQTVQNSTGSMLDPLSHEWQRLNRDVDATEDFLLASVP